MRSGNLPTCPSCDEYLPAPRLCQARAQPARSGLRKDGPREPGAGRNPAVARAAPTLIHIEAAVVHRIVPTPPEKAIAHDPLLPGVTVCHRVVLEPAGSNHCRCLPIDDLVRRPIPPTILRDPDTVPVGLKR